MPNIDGIIGYNSPSGVNKLFAAFGNDVVDVATGLGYGLNLTLGNKVQFETFIDNVFLCNGVNPMRSFVGGAWSGSQSLPPFLIPKYIKKSVNNTQLLVGNCTLAAGDGAGNLNAGKGVWGDTDDLKYRSYVFKSDLPKLGKASNAQAITQSLQWGIEVGKCFIYKNTSKLKAVYGEHDQLPYFITRNIQVGDPVFIVSENSGINVIGQYTVASVDSEYELTLNEKLRYDVEGVSFWVGNNWFQVGTDDSDQIMGFGENNSRDLIFKLFSLWYYTGTQLKQIKGAPGTSSQRSVINDSRGNTYYFHGSDIKKTGIYRFDGVSVVKASRAIDPFIEGMSASNFSEVVAWEEGDELRFFLGDISNNNENILMTNAVATVNTTTGAWDVSPFADVITCATKYIVSNIQNAYCGTNDSQVLKMGSGYTHNSTPIAAILETGIKYPAGSGILNSFCAIQVISKNARGVILYYKLWDDQLGRVDDRWYPLGQIMTDNTEFVASEANGLLKRVSAGIQFRVEEDGSLENNWLIEKISGFYQPDRTRLES